MKIVIYSAANCTWCVKAKELMRLLHLPYNEMSLNVDFTKGELREKMGVDENCPITVPQIWVNGHRVGGYEEFAEYCENHNIMGMRQ